MIAFKNLTFSYGKRAEVFQGLTAKLSEGHIHGLLGGNGVGKTTLLKLISGLIYPTDGTVEVDGIESRHRGAALYSQLYLLPEEFQLPSLTLQRFVSLSAPFYPNFSDEEFHRNCATLEIRSDKLLDRLSMGERKKGLIAFALACNTRTLLLDEPTNGLDIPSKGAFRRLLASYALPDRCIVLSTHQVRDVEQLIDNVLILDHEGIILNAPTEEITDRLYFGNVAEGEEALFVDESDLHRRGVLLNRAGDESRLSLELLFEASITRRKEIHSLFNHPNLRRHDK